MAYHERDFSHWLEKFYTTDNMPHRLESRTREDVEQSEYERFQHGSFIVE